MPTSIVLATCGLAQRWVASLDTVNGHYPIGLGILHALAEREGHRCETLYLVTETAETCSERIRAAVTRSKAQVLGLSIITDTRVASFRVIEDVHAEMPDVRIIVGGVHATVMYEQIIRRYPYLVAVLGEGEATFVDLLDAIETGRDLAGVAGIAYFDGERVVKTEVRPLIEDLDSLPLPRHDIFFSPQRSVGQLLTSRGCPYACSFCALDSVSRRRVRKRSVMNVVDEIEKIVTDHPQTDSIYIYDDQFFVDNKRVIAICDEIVRRGIKCAFYCQGRVKPLSRELVLALERAGFVSVTLGLESASPTILERCHKKIVMGDVERALHLFADSPIHITVLLIIGLPGESMATLGETANACQRLQKIKYHHYDSKVQDLFVYPGTEIYEIYKEAGKIDDDFWLSDGDCPRFELENHDAAYRIFRKQLLEHLNPFRLLTKRGFEAQVGMIPSILRFLFRPNAFLNLDVYLPLVIMAVERAIVEVRLVLSGATARPPGGFTMLTARRKPGTDNQVVLGHYAVENFQLPDFIRLAYHQEMTAVTGKIDAIFADFLKRAIENNDPVLQYAKDWIIENCLDNAGPLE